MQSTERDDEGSEQDASEDKDGSIASSRRSVTLAALLSRFGS
jgi:hypothetical protein